MSRLKPPSFFQKHLAAISPYIGIFNRPNPPASGKIHAAVYLFRHGIVEVCHHDYAEYIAPFLRRLCSLQRANRPFVKERLSFLSSYQSWITQAHVGMVSDEGFKQCSNLAREFRDRYKQWLIPTPGRQSPTVDVWTDSATRCRLSAVTFANAFTGKATDTTVQPDDYLQQVDSKVKVLHDRENSQQCDNLCWHTSFSVDQTVGHEEFEQLMQAMTHSAYKRLKSDWIGPTPLQAKQIYAMQLLHCYDVVAQQPSPFDGCFEPDDWARFEYLRDVKYHFSEGYGSPNPGFYAIPWMRAAIAALKVPQFHTSELPLRIAFTHREEVLYLCCLLGINFKKDWAPSLEKVEEDRQRRVSRLTPYLGHIGMETYSDMNSWKRMRVILNGNVTSAFWGVAEQDSDGGYDLDRIDQWAEMQHNIWQKFNPSCITFIR